MIDNYIINRTRVVDERAEFGCEVGCHLQKKTQETEK